MVSLTTDATRVIIDDFAKEIRERRQIGPAPKTTVINFRNDKINHFERVIYEVPVDLLRYRKDNGRICSDVLSYERTSLQPLDETKQETQDILFRFLYNKDKEKTEILRRSIKKGGQDEPAIITCDGFLINGNRRKMVFQLLHKEDLTKYNTMKVVILPGVGEEGGPPTIREIELLENRYQLQQDGKSEYGGLDRALSIKRKISCGISLEEQLQDDPSCATLSEKEFNKVVAKCKKEFLDPLERAEEYLKSLGRQEHYMSISSATGDSEGRWQAFIDYSNFYNGKLKDKGWRMRNNIGEDEIGDIEDIAFKIIKKRTISGRSKKLHEMMRDMPGLLSSKDSKDCLFELVSKVDLYDDQEYPDLRDADSIWSNKNNEIFAKCINTAYGFRDKQKEIESALSLLKAAHRNLTHELMIVSKIPKSDLKEFCQIAEEIIDVTTDLKNQAWSEHKKKN